MQRVGIADNKGLGYGLLFLLFCHALTPVAWAQSLDENKSVKVKAAYLYSFSKFVTWPETKFPEKTSPIRLGILSTDADQLKQLLDEVANTKGLIQNRQLEIIVVDYVPGSKRQDQIIDERQHFEASVRSCHMLFVDQSNKKMRMDIFQLISDYKVLSVGGGDGFVRGGGMVALVRKGESIIFQVNVNSVNKEELIISPKLLRNAILIR